MKEIGIYILFILGFMLISYGLLRDWEKAFALGAILGWFGRALTEILYELKNR